MFWQPRQVHPNTAHAKNKSSEHYKGHFPSGGGRRELTVLFQGVVQLQEMRGAGREG